MSTTTTSLTLTDILAARERIGAAVYRTPCTRSEMLSRMTGQSVFLKLENLQMTGSFKERGALNKIAMLTRGAGDGVAWWRRARAIMRRGLRTMRRGGGFAR